MILQEWIAFYSAFLNIHRSGVLTALAWLVPQESAARENQSRRVLCTPYNHAPCHFMQSHIRKVYACLAVTGHLRFWQNDRGLLRATAVTRGWNGYRNKSQHRKLTLEKKILRPLQQGFKPATFRSRVRRSNHWAIPAPHCELFPFRSSATITSNRQLQLTNPTVPMYKSAYGLCYDLDSKENSPLKLLEHTIQNVYLGLKNVQQMSSTVAVLSQYSLDTPHFGCKPSLSNCCCKQTIYYIMHNKTNRSI